jgi:hypothetical protein
MVTVTTGIGRPARSGPARADRPVGPLSYARLLEQQAAIGWRVAAGWATMLVSVAGAVADQARTVEALVNDRADRVADLADAVELQARDTDAEARPAGQDVVGSAGPMGRPWLTLVTERDPGGRAGGSEPVARFAAGVPTAGVFADVVDVLVAADIRAAR